MVGATTALTALSRLWPRPEDINMTQFDTMGYAVVDGVFAPGEIERIRDGVIRHKRQQGSKFSALGLFDPGLTIPDFMARREFEFMHYLPYHPPLHRVLHRIFGGQPFRYCSHNDIGVNRIVNWHKDKLNDAYSHYQRLPLWGPGSEGPDGGHFIVKALVYLQDHAGDDHGLLVVPGSHTTPSMARSRTARMRPRKGSVVIFEQRLTHRGMTIGEGLAHHLRRDADDRILVSLGFGLRNNHTAEFEAGTIARQAAQCGDLCS